MGSILNYFPDKLQKKIAEEILDKMEEIEEIRIRVKVININYVYSLNFRIAKEVIGAGNNILKYILNVEENSIFNTLIVSAPGSR